MKNIMIYGVSYKTLTDPKPLCVSFDQIDGFVRIHDGVRYVTLFGLDKYEAI